MRAHLNMSDDGTDEGSFEHVWWWNWWGLIWTCLMVELMRADLNMSDSGTDEGPFEHVWWWNWWWLIWTCLMVELMRAHLNMPDGGTDEGWFEYVWWWNSKAVSVDRTNILYDLRKYLGSPTEIKPYEISFFYLRFMYISICATHVGWCYWWCHPALSLHSER